MKSTLENYYQDMILLLSKIPQAIDCIIAVKRSGWILGVFLSNQLKLPILTCSEIESLPDKFKNILIVDDKICKGKAIRKVYNKLKAKNKLITTACLYVEGKIKPDYYCTDLNNTIVKMWYEL